MKTEEQQEWETSRFDSEQDSYNSLLMRLDPSPTIHKLEMYLLREKLDDKNRRIKIEGKLPRVTDDGVDELITELQARMSVDKVLSITQKNDVAKIELEVGEVIRQFIFFNEGVYKIDQRDFDSIFFMIIHNIGLFLRRTLGGKENELITRAFQQRETVVKRGDLTEQTTQTSPSGMSFGRFSPFGGQR